MRDAIAAHPRLLQVVKIFVPRNRTPAQRTVGQGLQQGPFPAGFDAGFDEVTHGGR